MSAHIAICDPEGARHLLKESHVLMQALFEPNSNHMLSLEALKGPGIRFFGAEDAGQIIGCGALALRDGYGEVKSMFVDEKMRGQGIAAALLDRIEEEAKAIGLPLLRLETGNLLRAALRLYERHGFVRCGAFGEYPAGGDASVFMEKSIG